MNEVSIEEMVEILACGYSEYCEKEKNPELFNTWELEDIAQAFNYSFAELLLNCIESATISEKANGGLTIPAYPDTI